MRLSTGMCPYLYPDSHMQNAHSALESHGRGRLVPQSCKLLTSGSSEKQYAVDKKNSKCPSYPSRVINPVVPVQSSMKHSGQRQPTIHRLWSKKPFLGKNTTETADPAQAAINGKDMRPKQKTPLGASQHMDF